MNRAIPAIVLGASGYVGGEFLRLLALHPVFELAAAVSDSRKGERIGDAFPHLGPVYGERRFAAQDDWPADIDVSQGIALFSAAPHGTSAKLVAGAIAATAAHGGVAHVVDASADFRYADAAGFQAVYGEAHGAPHLLPQFSSGVPEHVTGTPTPHVGHPGCFATAMLLAAVPLLASDLSDGEFFVSGVTGSTGSGRIPQPGTHHPDRHDNLYAYKPLEHRHVPEVEGLAERATGRRPVLRFVPHSGPFARGIHVTLQARLKPGVTAADLRRAYETAYGDTPFVELVSGAPRLKDIVASNRAQIGVTARDGGGVVLCVIDNLVKGAAGGAIQWMNRLFGLPETTGLTAPAPAWT
jgi:N-acetyl-gamma-glutamyl-phosphate reductase